MDNMIILPRTYATVPEVLLTAMVQFVVQGNHPLLCRQEVQLHPVFPVIHAGHRSSFHAAVGKAFDPAALQAQMVGFYQSLCK